MSSFPVFDEPRADVGFDGHGERHIRHEVAITARVDATDEWITVPVRSVFVSDGLTGWSFEVGPYSIGGPDATALVNALSHYGRLSGDFRPTGQGGAA